MSPFVGRVTAVHRGLGAVDVQWPYANERMSPDEIVKVDPRVCAWLPPEFDQSYSSYDIQKARAKWASKGQWAGTKLPPGFYTELAKQWSNGRSEVEAYDNAWHKFASVDDSLAREEIQKFYRVSNRLGELRVQQFAKKSAAYWVAQNRQYRITADEFKSRSPNCPKCGSCMKRTTYKMAEGNRVRLFACPKDLFLIKSDSIIGPLGEPVGW